MLLTEPSPTAYDIRFRLGGIPIRVSVWFWIVVLVIGALTIQGLDPEVIQPAVGFGLVGLVVFLSILVHEYGHAILMRRRGESPRIVLYHMGGLAIPDRVSALSRRPVEQILISLAGPMAGFLLAIVTALAVVLGGGRVTFAWAGDLTFWNVSGIPNAYLELFVGMMLWINIAWGLLNLLPVYPLDGGQMARAGLTLVNRSRGLIWSLYLSIATAALMAILAGTMWRSIFLVLLFASCAVEGFMTLKQLRRGDGWSGGPNWHPDDDRPWKRWR